MILNVCKFIQLNVDADFVGSTAFDLERERVGDRGCDWQATRDNEGLENTSDGFDERWR